MNCNKCGAKAEKGDIYCGQCGNKLPIAENTKQYQNNANNEPKSPKKKSKVKNIIFIIVIILGLLLIIGLFSEDTEETNTNNISNSNVSDDVENVTNIANETDINNNAVNTSSSTSTENNEDIEENTNISDNNYSVSEDYKYAYEMYYQASNDSSSYGNIRIELEDTNIYLYDDEIEMYLTGTYKFQNGCLVGTYTEVTYNDGGDVSTIDISDSFKLEIIDNQQLQDVLGYGQFYGEIYGQNAIYELVN